ncbi:DNA fragmentation factor subunit beta [Suncus etruscus]|uniref:DNA fragmentation factor subunit beta n=1 Tax=Suncus etruscus TaxID=109475 RepID=UPI0021107BDA|nr:DNA fragmentation factor subunit beta [Suncus etruscus]
MRMRSGGPAQCACGRRIPLAFWFLGFCACAQEAPGPRLAHPGNVSRRLRVGEAGPRRLAFWPKAFKLRVLHGPQKFGVAGRSPEEVLRKGCRLLQVPEQGARLCLYADGGELRPEDFGRVADNTELLLLAKGQTWQGYLGDLGRLLSVLHRPQAALVQAARRLLEDEQAPLRQRLLADLLSTVSENIAAETRGQDPPWFEGLEPRFRSKAAYLRHSCASRLRSYLREVSAHTPAVEAAAREEYTRLVGAMAQKLRAEHFQGSYFDRGAPTGRLCTPEGWFSCQGPFDMAACESRHSINPYGSRESRILFSTWNLDHVIEKKRSVVPALAEAVAARNGREVDWEYFYRLLFTCENLKLVHIACHKKTTHQLSCDPDKVYKPQSQRPRKQPARRGR